jgi:N-acetylglucosamine transport system permease protein
MGKFFKKLALGESVIQFIFISYLIIVVFPFLWTFIGSFKTTSELFINPWGLPQTWLWHNYVDAWREAHIGDYFFNSILITFTSVFFIVLIAALASYVLARFEFPGRTFIYYLFVSGLIFPIFLGLIPLFILLKNLHIIDTRIGLLAAYIAYSLPFTIFFLTPFFKNLPHELHEAALIDGATEFQVFGKVMLPMAKPGIAMVGIFNFLGIWNEYVLALVIISREELKTLPLGLANMYMVQHYQSNWGALFAGLIIVMLPILIIYMIFRKYLTEIVTAGALKG